MLPVCQEEFGWLGWNHLSHFIRICNEDGNGYEKRRTKNC